MSLLWRLLQWCTHAKCIHVHSLRISWKIWYFAMTERTQSPYRVNYQPKRRVNQDSHVPSKYLMQFTQWWQSNRIRPDLSPSSFALHVSPHSPMFNAYPHHRELHSFPVVLRLPRWRIPVRKRCDTFGSRPVMDGVGIVEFSLKPRSC